MKALMGSIIKKVLKDKSGSDEVARYIASGKPSGIIRLTNGETYKISNSRESATTPQ